jgi:V/A-type H+-transporting ATPase subunit D
MSATRLVPTRSNLLRGRAQLDRVRKGADAVGRKRQALVAQLFRIARPAIDARTEIGKRMTEAAAALYDAVSATGIDALRTVAMPAANVTVDVEPSQIWGVAVADVTPSTKGRRTFEARGYTPGAAGGEVDRAADAFESMVELLLAAAAGEVRVARLADAVSSTSRQLRLLRERVEPGLVAQIAMVAATLDEREREEHVRLKHLQRRAGGS